MRTITVNTKQGPLTVQTSLNLGQAASVLEDSKNGFAQDLISAYRKWGHQLTQGRANWLLVLGQQELDRRAQPAQAVQLGDLQAIYGLFQKAGKNLKFPKIRLLTPNLINVVLAPRTAGGINVTNGVRYGHPDSRFFGRIEENGSFNTRTAPEEVKLLLQRFAADPAGVAAEYGKLAGACCFCGMELTDERSIHVGYGPTCAGNYGLPWGERPTEPVLGSSQTVNTLGQALLDEIKDFAAGRIDEVKPWTSVQQAETELAALAAVISQQQDHPVQEATQMTEPVTPEPFEPSNPEHTHEYACENPLCAAKGTHWQDLAPNVSRIRTGSAVKCPTCKFVAKLLSGNQFQQMGHGTTDYPTGPIQASETQAGETQADDTAPLAHLQENQPDMVKKPYSVLLRYPDYASDGDETYYAFVEAADSVAAVTEAQQKAILTNEWEDRDPADFAPLLVIEGHHYGQKMTND
jgi:hypothetical protein